MIKKKNYNYQELIDCGKGKLFGKGNAKLPLPPLLMFDRITEINENKGSFKKGFIKAELDIKKNLWFFDCHFKEDPVMPGCLGLDAMWQLVGFFLGWLGEPGKGRALRVSDLRPEDRQYFLELSGGVEDVQQLMMNTVNIDSVSQIAGNYQSSRSGRKRRRISNERNVDENHNRRVAVPPENTNSSSITTIF